jgi:methionine sulfoxide reductase heme-binding subunit
MSWILLHPYSAAALAIALEAAAAFAAFGTGVEGMQALARYSGRAGLAWFALIFMVAPWHQLARSPTSKLAMRQRRHLGLAFGSHHLAHLAFLLTYLAASGKGLDPARAAGGMAGYAAIVVMMATSTDAAVARLGARSWRRLHRTCLWYVWIVFFVTYASRLLGKVPDAGGSVAEFVPCMAVVIVVAMFRAGVFVTRKRRAFAAFADI